MADYAPVIQKLRQLGLTRTEAEIYVAALGESSAGPVSAYKVAQSMGRDPANLAKNLAALEKLGAVRVVQEKPRLYLPILPAEFTNALTDRMKGIGKELVSQLEEFNQHPPSGLTLALRNNEQAFEQAATMLQNCSRELLLFASRDVVDYLSKDFSELACRGDCRVRFLGVDSSGIALAEDTIIPMPKGFSETGPLPWLQMIVDRKTWLVAQFNRTESEDFPCGWWGDDPVMASIMACSLDAACDGVPYEFTPPDKSDLEGHSEFDNVRIEPDKPDVQKEPEEPGKTKEKPEPPMSTDAPPPKEIEPEEEEEEDNGFKFVVRHEEDED